MLVLEDLAHLEQGDCTTDLSLPRARSLVHGLAGLHGPLWNDPDLETAPWLRSRPHAWGRDRFADRRARFLDRFADRVDGLTGPLLDRIEAPYAAAVERLTAAPPTLLHGDLHVDNTPIDPTTDEARIIDVGTARAVQAVHALEDEITRFAEAAHASPHLA